MIFNDKKEDEEGEYTFYGEKEVTVIDYIIWDGKTKERVEEMRRWKTR